MGLFLARRIAGFRYGGRLELLDGEGGGTVARLEIGPRRMLAGVEDGHDSGPESEPESEESEGRGEKR